MKLSTITCLLIISGTASATKHNIRGSHQRRLGKGSKTSSGGGSSHASSGKSGKGSSKSAKGSKSSKGGNSSTHNMNSEGIYGRYSDEEGENVDVDNEATVQIAFMSLGSLSLDMSMSMDPTERRLGGKSSKKSEGGGSSPHSKSAKGFAGKSSKGGNNSSANIVDGDITTSSNTVEDGDVDIVSDLADFEVAFMSMDMSLSMSM
jgi:hypothetical protein